MSWGLETPENTKKEGLIIWWEGKLATILFSPRPLYDGMAYI